MGIKGSKNLPQNLKNLSADKPDSVLGYHLSGCNITVTILLPTLQRIPQKAEFKQAAFKRWCTWHCSTQGLPIYSITATNRELLPHIFTLITPLA